MPGAIRVAPGRRPRGDPAASPALTAWQGGTMAVSPRLPRPRRERLFGLLVLGVAVVLLVSSVTWFGTGQTLVGIGQLVLAVVLAVIGGFLRRRAAPRLTGRLSRADAGPPRVAGSAEVLGPPRPGERTARMRRRLARPTRAVCRRSAPAVAVACQQHGGAEQVVPTAPRRTPRRRLVPSPTGSPLVVTPYDAAAPGDERRRDQIVIGRSSVGCVARTDAPQTPDLGVDEDVPREDGDAVNVDKQDLVRMLRAQGDNDTADKAEAGLPDQIDTDRDADALAAVGLDRDQLMAKLAAGGLGGVDRAPSRLSPL